VRYSCCVCLYVPFTFEQMDPFLPKFGKNVKKSKAIPVTDRGSPQGCETSRLPHFLDNRLTDGGEVVSLTRRPPLPPMKIPGTHFC
jgi:hypothetical protein